MCALTVRAHNCSPPWGFHKQPHQYFHSASHITGFHTSILSSHSNSCSFFDYSWVYRFFGWEIASAGWVYMIFAILSLKLLYLTMLVFNSSVYKCYYSHALLLVRCEASSGDLAFHTAPHMEVLVYSSCFFWGFLRWRPSVSVMSDVIVCSSLHSLDVSAPIVLAVFITAHSSKLFLCIARARFFSYCIIRGVFRLLRIIHDLSSFKYGACVCLCI